MRKRLWISSLAAAGLLVVGSVAPAYAASSAIAAQGSVVTAETHGVSDHARTAGMAKMHKQMKGGMADMDMADMDMTDMAKMGGTMKAHHPDATTDSAHTHSSEEDRS